MRVLITGGAGFIGSHIVDHYLRHGERVFVIDSLITGSKQNIVQHLTNDRFEFVNEDICDVVKVDGAFDLVLHLASPASPFDYLKYPIQTMRTASVGTQNMLNIAREKGARFLLASTSEVYGDPTEHPQTEEYWGNVNPVGPRAVYDEGKRFAEALTAAYRRAKSLNTCIVRIFNTYGERMQEHDGRVIPAFIGQALENKDFTIFGDGSQTRSFCYISDMVDGITRAAKADLSGPVNLGNPKEYTMLEVADLVRKRCGCTSGYEFMPLPENDPKRRKPDIRKAKELLGWEPNVPLEQGIDKVIEYFRRKK